MSATRRDSISLSCHARLSCSVQLRPNHESGTLSVEPKAEEVKVRTNNNLLDLLETTEPECLATGFIFTEGPLWHPGGYWYFVDLRRNQLLRLTPGNQPELVRTTIGGNGTTFDLQGRLIVC